MFGHGDCLDDIMPLIEAAIEDHYSKHGITLFYVGNRGRFDSLAATAVKWAKQRHSDIRLYLLLAYHPGERTVDLTDSFDNSFYPPLEKVPRRYAIVRANKYMIDTADSIICYVKHIGNTRNLLAYAQRRQQKEMFIIENVADY
jgi:hypothetical protein